MSAKKLSKTARLKRDLDAAPPMGFSTPMHQDPAAQESMLKVVANQIDKGLKREASEISSIGFQPSVPFVGRTPLLYVDPLFDPLLFLFPKDRIDEINKRLRHYYEVDAIVGNAIDLHSQLPLSDFYLQCEDKEIERYWNDFKDRSGLVDFLQKLLHDYWLLGEGIGLPVWDPHNFEFSHFNQYPPENVDIFRTYATPTAFFMLKPDPDLQKKLNSGADVDQTMMKMMDPAYVESLKEGKPFLLGSDKRVIYLARQTTKYRHRGVSILTRCLKDLLYKDKLRLLQLTFIDRHTHPIKIFKLGSEQRGWIPNRKHFDRLRQLLTQASNDPDFNILYHFGLQVDYVGTKDKVMNLIPEFEWVERQVMAALFVNDEIIHGGIPSAVRDTVNLRTLMHRYLSVRESMERIMIQQIFLPIAQARGFYKKAYIKTASKVEKHTIMRQGKKVELDVIWRDKAKGLYTIAHNRHAGLDISAYDLPRPIWKKMNLINNLAEQQLMMKMEEDGKLPLEMLFDILGMDSKTVKKKMYDQESTPFAPLWRKIRDDIAQDPKIRMQVLRGDKPDQWSLPPGEELGAPTAPAGGAAPAAKKPAAAPAAAPAKPGVAPPKPGAKPAPGGATPPTQPGGAPPLNVTPQTAPNENQPMDAVTPAPPEAK